MWWQIVKKEIKENYMYISVFVGLLMILSLYASFRKAWKPEEILFLSFVLSGLGGIILVFYGIYRGFSSFKREKERNTLEFLMSLPIDGQDVIPSKFLAFIVEAFVSALVTYFLSLVPALVSISFVKAIKLYDFLRLAKFVLLLDCSLFLVSLYAYAVFNLFEIFSLSFKLKGFITKAVFFSLFIYLTFRLFHILKGLLKFIPQESYEILFLGEVLNFGADYRGLAAGTLLTIFYLGVSVVLYSKRMEV
ncbi:MAG: ABC transporter permease subunit [candidate division WOR-3 bacterium]